MTHVMVDLETWGVMPGSALRSIGAVVFNPETGDIGGKFYRNISDESCEALGMPKDPSTVKWWAEQSDDAQSALLANPQPLGDVVLAFTAWWKKVGGQYIWGHGANFDPVLLEAAYEACMLEKPWDFWNVRCSRTVLAMANRKPVRSGGTHHNALDDAIAQSKAIAAAFRAKQFNPR